ncbi:BnaC08g08550D [Brassica napus]|uniref:BnaC08g08550D protein n=1 Tax=Brassica napus TaxID=3708 RepID=A0A078G0D8_BRANA|nr:BnaC08g08550D [Brassica napus]
MANALVFLSDLQTGRSSSTVHVRLLRFWEARNVRPGGDLMGVDMLLLDSEATMMPATINVNRLATHQPSLKAGSVYSLTGFDVARCNPNYRLSDSSLLIRFSDTTSFVEVTKPAVPIPLESFRFRNHSEMLGLSNSNNQLSDLIGEITAVKSTVTDPLQDKNRVMATIKMYNGTLVTMSLFDTHAVAIYNRLEKMGSDPRVVVATSINPKMLGGRLFLNATSGTHIYFDKETAASTAAGESFFNRLVGEATGVTPAAPLLRGYAKVDALTIAELNNFVITAPSHDIDFICNGRGLKSRWIRDGAMFRAQTVPRNFNAPPHRSHVCLLITLTQLVSSDTYRVEMSIADETGEGLFVCFDGVMTKLHNMRISEGGQLLLTQLKQLGVSSYQLDGLGGPCGLVMGPWAVGSLDKAVG